MDNAVINTNVHYYIAFVDEQAKKVEIKTNSKQSRAYFKGKITDENKDVVKVFKLRGHTVDEVYANLCEVIGEDYTLDVHRNRQHMPTVMPIEL